MKIWKAEFKPMWPVGGCLIIAAPDYDTAVQIARDTVVHTTVDSVFEVDITKAGVIEYKSGDY
jgi:hypothetical protein